MKPCLLTCPSLSRRIIARKSGKKEDVEMKED